MGKGGGGDESSGEGCLEAAWSFFRPGAEYTLEMSLVGGTRDEKELIIKNYPNIELADSRDTCPLIGLSFLEEGGSEIRGAEVSGGERF